MKHLIINIITILFSIGPLNAQVPKTSELFLALKKQDSIFFERGFNRCDMAYLDTAVHKDLMFYHDKGGMQNREKFFENVKRGLCPVTPPKPIRKVDPQSLEVYPLYDNNVLYGVIQNGIHHFYLREPNKADVMSSSAKFTHLYLLLKGQWVLKEVLSFDHQDPK